jgi:tRNA pseudouridine55 synthase
MPGPHGLVIIDKPAGITSHDAVRRLRKVAKTRRVGHAGTLDPMATGVLILGLGRATRLLGHLALTNKDYTATIRLGQSTVTDDAEGDIMEERDATAVTDEAIAREIAKLSGDILQVPTQISAIKVDGKRSYARVRAGEEVELKARPVTVSRFDVISTDRSQPGVVDLQVEVSCSTGTYVRALARDVGEALGVGGHLTALRRTRVGPFSVESAVTLPEADSDQGVNAFLVGLDAAVTASFPLIEVDEATSDLVLHGIPLSQADATAGGWTGTDQVCALMCQGRSLGLFQLRDDKLRSLVVFA